MPVSLDGEYFFSYMVPDSTEGEVIIYPSSTVQAQKGTFQQEVKYDENGKTYQQLSIQLTSGEKFYYALSVSGTTQTITSADYDEWSLSANTDSLVYGLKEDVTEKYQTDYPKLEKLTPLSLSNKQVHAVLACLLQGLSHLVGTRSASAMAVNALNPTDCFFYRHTFNKAHMPCRLPSHPPITCAFSILPSAISTIIILEQTPP